MQYLSSESSKLQSSDMVFSTVYVLILEQLLVQKILYFLCLYGMWQSPTFQIIYKRPLSRSFLDRGVILWDWIAHVIKYLQMQWNSLFSSMVFFLALIFRLFILKCSDPNLCSLWLIVFWNIKMMYWKRQDSQSCIFAKI